jgi:hypothetical protein
VYQVQEKYKQKRLLFQIIEKFFEFGRFSRRKFPQLTCKVFGGILGVQEKLLQTLGTCFNKKQGYLLMKQ